MTISNLIASEVERNYNQNTESENINTNQEESENEGTQNQIDEFLPLDQISDINTPLRGVETPNRQPRTSTF